MPEGQVPRRKDDWQRDPGDDLRTRRRTERRKPELKPGRVLALDEIGTSLTVLLVVEQMVDQVRRERNQVCEEEARHEPSGDESIGPSHLVPII